MAKDNYDRDEMEMRGLAYNVARLEIACLSLLQVMEWETLKQKYKLKDDDYPGISSNVKAARAFLDPKSNAYRQLFDNPLTKLAIISQPFEKTKEEQDGK